MASVCWKMHSSRCLVSLAGDSRRVDLLVFRIDARTNFRVGLGLETLAIFVDRIQHVALLIAVAVFNYDDAILFHLDGQPAALACLSDSLFADAALGAID
eukprot:3517689-Prymnesium_polylepis.1